jgi:hypothetical protein
MVSETKENKITIRANRYLEKPFEVYARTSDGEYTKINFGDTDL